MNKSIETPDWQREGKEVVNEMLTETFNSILRIEERSLNNRLTEGLSIAELHTIVAVGLHEVNPMKVVASRLDVTLATLTASMTKLERKGYVQRTRSEVDRRQVLVQLTSKGRKAFRAHDAFHKKMADSALASILWTWQSLFAISKKSLISILESQKVLKLSKSL